MVHNKKLLSYQVLCSSVFITLFFFYYTPIDLHTWVAIVIFTAAAVLFDLRPIVLPSGDNLSLVTPLLFTAGLLYGIFSIFMICTMMTLTLIIVNYKKWVAHIFNGVQFSIAGVVGLSLYALVENTNVHSFIINLPAFLSFAVGFFVTNILLLTSYLTLRDNKPIKMFLKILCDKKAVLIFFTMMALGLIMAVVVNYEGIFGLIVFCTIMWTLGVSYRNYYQMFDHFRSLSEKDELTKLYNHRYFQEQLQSMLKNKGRLALLIIDIDYFKIYNDTFGHPEGDKLLRNIADLLRRNIPSEGVACRYGGEEFTIILPDTGADQALVIAENIRKVIAETKFYGIKHMPSKRITVSIGVSTSPDMATKREELIMLADQALYKTKYSSRNKVQLYTSVIDELKGTYTFSSKAEDEVLQSLKTFLMIINSKDRYTYSHTERIMEYAECLANKIGLADEDVKRVRYGALLHDIGKVEVPSEILNKSTKLEDHEWETIKAHVLWGEQMVEPIKELKHCLPIIRHHHERYDGKGYPDQISGENIPLEARILTIADCFDAMTTNRPYQKAKTVNEAIEEIKRCAGTQFDPKLVDPFIEVITELKPNHVHSSARKQMLNVN